MAFLAATLKSIWSQPAPAHSPGAAGASGWVLGEQAGTSSGSRGERRAHGGRLVPYLLLSGQHTFVLVCCFLAQYND